MTGRRILSLAAAAGALLLLGCAQPGRTGPAAPPDPPVPSDAYTLRADGTVPWVDERLTDEDLAPHPAVPAPDSRPCRGEVDVRLYRAESPLTPLTVAVTGPDSARPGDRVVYHVALSTLTDHPVPLGPCPGYRQEVTAPGFAGAALFRLNCRPVHEIAAGHTVRYEMALAVPEKLPAGTRLTVLWSIRAPQRLGAGAHLYGEFTLTV